MKIKFKTLKLYFFMRIFIILFSLLIIVFYSLFEYINIFYLIIKRNLNEFMKKFRVIFLFFIT